jgi:hypothetical protein
VRNREVVLRVDWFRVAGSETETAGDGEGPGRTDRREEPAATVEGLHTRPYDPVR